MVLRTEDEKQKTIDSVSFFNNTEFLKIQLKLSRYTPCRRYRGEEKLLQLTVDLGTRCW
jgi:hypothetical protein